MQVAASKAEASAHPPDAKRTQSFQNMLQREGSGRYVRRDKKQSALKFLASVVRKPSPRSSGPTSPLRSNPAPKTLAVESKRRDDILVVASQQYYASSKLQREIALRRRFLTAYPPCGPITGGTTLTLSLLTARQTSQVTALFAGDGWVRVAHAYPHEKEPKFAVCCIAPPCEAPGPVTVQLRVGDTSASGESITEYKVRAMWCGTDMCVERDSASQRRLLIGHR